MNDFVIPLNINYPTDQYRQKYTDLYSHFLDSDHPEITKSSFGDSYFISSRKHDWGQSIVEDYLELEVETCRIFVVKPYQSLRAHIDCIADSQELRHCSINFPLHNCDLGKNEWYDNTQFPTVFNKRASSIIPENYSDLDNIEPIFYSRLYQPSIFRTNIMHNVNNIENPNYRVVLSMRFKDNITWEYIKNKLNSDK